MKTLCSKKAKLCAGLAIGLCLLVGIASGLSNIALVLGTVSEFDFGGYGPGHPVPGTIQIHAFRLNPGDSLPWHYHKGLSYVVLTHGSLTERHLIGPSHCASEQVTAGAAFVEAPGQIHNVTNTGSGAAFVWWATVFPKSDGITQFGPDFSAGGVYPVNAPSCN